MVPHVNLLVEKIYLTEESLILIAGYFIILRAGMISSNQQSKMSLSLFDYKLDGY